MELLDYLNQHFLTRDQLLQAAGLGGAQLDAWTDALAMPRPSYRVRLALDCDSFFGAHAERATLDYYARGSVAWIGALEAAECAPYALFARRYRDALTALPLRSRDPRLGAGLEAHLEQEWRHFLDGTYGLCTRSGLPEDIAAKELAICVIREITEQEQAPDLAQLRTAVDMLDRAASPLAPHERARSSRRRWVDEVRARYGLDANTVCL